ncbi:MAG: hypothetical protein M0Q01_10765 [Syntrophales bacterium]|jgi:hypothetical protein|nr:hypothetical protein [Syntrophales bacterium]
MAKRNQNTFFKRQKEIKRRQDAQEKMARRQGKKKQDEQEGEEMQLVAPADADTEPVEPTTEPAGPTE